jgi:hypothetical protein
VKFKPLPSVIDGARSWGSANGNCSFVVSFDDRHPAFGWRASYRQHAENTTYLPDTFISRKEAERALEKIARISVS